MAKTYRKTNKKVHKGKAKRSKTVRSKRGGGLFGDTAGLFKSRRGENSIIEKTGSPFDPYKNYIHPPSNKQPYVKEGEAPLSKYYTVDENNKITGYSQESKNSLEKLAREQTERLAKLKIKEEAEKRKQEAEKRKQEAEKQKQEAEKRKQEAKLQEESQQGLFKRLLNKLPFGRKTARTTHQ